MISEFLIAFRETLEAALIIGIILAYLKKTKNEKYNNVAYMGIVFGVLGSIAAALLFSGLLGAFEGFAEQVFEGTTMILGAVLLTTMILWMMRASVAREIKHKVSMQIDKNGKLGLFMLIFISILREGVETVIFLGAAAVSGSFSIISGLLGMAVASILGFLIFVASIKIDIKKFFNISSVLLIFFAAGLVAHGVHEFEEAGLLSPIVEHVWDINPQAPLASSGIYPAFHEKGAVGSIFVGLFGYNGNPSLLEVISYLAYILVVSLSYKHLITNSHS
ncbi:MAG: FTR1 family protein [Candidatus Woesearchaeota archaeon]|nr:FTR1 family protein [Candidatus Woesearchaeota archaeon]